MTRLQQLKATTDRKQLAVLLGLKPKALAYIVYKKPLAAKYSTFEIQKRSGGVRTINAPTADLKSLQARLAGLLQDCISDINEGKKISGAISHGFRRKRSIITNARCHRGKRYVFNIDISNFFDTINFGRVRGFFLKNNNFNLNPEVATTIAQIACHNNTLPQGSPCSPVISNLVAHFLDIRLAKLAQTHGCDYSRYADDLTFSTNKATFPAAIARSAKSTPHVWQPGKELKDIIKRSGFALNAAKTRMQYHESRQDVTGLVVNTKVNVRAEYQRTARAMAHSLFKTGAFFTTCHEPDVSGAMIEKQVPGTLNQLQGILSFTHNVKKSNWNKSNPQPKKLIGYEELYRDFLFYKNFYANGRPLILFEGKTDNIYIRCAIKSLAAKFPALAQMQGTTATLRVDFMNYTTTTGRMLGLSGGTGNLSNLVQSYKTEWKKFAVGHLKQPVVLMLDNDQGSKGVFNSICKVTGKPVTGKEEFIHVCYNLYVVLTPQTAAGKDTTIEDFFRKSVLDQKLAGKSFNPDKASDSKTEYGKYVFAERIVRAQQKTIDFSKFRPILDRIDKAIADYVAKAP